MCGHAVSTLRNPLPPLFLSQTAHTYVHRLAYCELYITLGTFFRRFRDLKVFGDDAGRHGLRLLLFIPCCRKELVQGISDAGRGRLKPRSTTNLFSTCLDRVVDYRRSLAGRKNQQWIQSFILLSKLKQAVRNARHIMTLFP